MPRTILFQPTQSVSFQSTASWKPSNHFDDLIPSFQKQSNEPTKEILPQVDDRACFLIKNIFTKDECKNIIEAAENTGFEYRQFEGENKDSASCVVESKDFAACVFDRIKHIVPEKSYYDAGLGIVLSDLNSDELIINYWGQLTTINSSIRVERYNSNQRLKMHRDGLVAVKDQPQTYTIFAVLIYLNDEYEGGFTRFAVSKNPKNPMDLYEYLDLKANTGSALVFRHEILHAGSPITNDATKYILRLDLGYKIIE